jgi:hypothetical protein
MSRMRFRKLRIAWSVGWGIVAVLLCVLWVRSYWYADDLARFQHGRMYLIESAWGSVRPVYSNKEPPTNLWLFSSDRLPNDGGSYAHPVFGWDADDFPLYFQAYIPHWIVALLFAIAAVAPWIHWSRRFSLRTLLIATTLVAVVLRLIAWIQRAG